MDTAETTVADDSMTFESPIEEPPAIDLAEPGKRSELAGRPILVTGSILGLGLALVVGFSLIGGSDDGDADAVGLPSEISVAETAPPGTEVVVVGTAAPAVALDAPGTEIGPPGYTADEVMVDLFMQSFLGIALFDEDFVSFLGDPTLPDLFVVALVDSLLRTSFLGDEIVEGFGDLGPVPVFSGFAPWWLPLPEPVENPQVAIFDLYAPMADIAFAPGSLNTPAQNVLAVAVEIDADLTDPAVCAGKELVLVLNIYNPEWGDPYVANPRFPGEYYAGGNFFPNFNLSDCTPTSYADAFFDDEIVAGLATSGVALFTVNDGVTRGVILLSEETVNADASLHAILFEHPVGETFFPENTRYQSAPDIFDPASLINDSITLSDFTLVPITTEPASTATTTTTSAETVDPGAQVEAFVTEFAAATKSDDIDFLLAHLHPLSVQASDQQTCAAFVSREIVALDEYRATGPAQQTVLEFVISDQTVTVDPAFEISVVFTFSEQEFTDNARFAPVDGVMHYFATCR